MKTWFQPIMHLRNDEQKVVADGYPNLRVDSITGCSVESLDVKVLLDPLEKDLNLPPVTVEFSNRDCLKCEVIGQEPIYRQKAGPVQILGAEVKRSLNISQSRMVGELRKAHHQELVPAVELDRMSVAAVAVDTLLELVFVDERHDLREDGFTLVHDLRTAA